MTHLKQERSRFSLTGGSTLSPAQSKIDPTRLWMSNLLGSTPTPRASPGKLHRAGGVL